MLDAIRNAKSSINIEIYIFDDGKTATLFTQALAEKARAGVEVRLLIDGVGARPGMLEDVLESAGVKVHTYRPLRIYSIYRLGNRTHRKVMTVDGRIGFCGGVGTR